MDKRKQTLKYIFVDLLSAALAWLLFNIVRFHECAHADFVYIKSFLLYYQVLKGQIVIPICWTILYALTGYYNKPFGKSRIGELFTTFTSVVVGSVLIFFTVILNDLPESFDIYYRMLFSLALLQFVLAYTGRALITSHAIRKHWRREWFENVLIIGTGKNAVRMRDNLYLSGYNIIGFVRANDNVTREVEDVLGAVDNMPEIMRVNKVDEIVVAIDSGDIVQLLYNLYCYRIPIKVITEKNDLLSKVRLKSIHEAPTIDVTENHFSEMEKNIKWLTDKILSTIVLLLLSPLFLYVAIRVKAGSKGPVFFRQERIGYRGKPFFIYKFRSMYTDAAQQGPLLTARDDDRVTPFGRFLRKYRIDEIPQFWNVLKGDMSIVGPRPEQRYYIDRIVRKAPYYYLLHNVRPGITSLGMVKYGYAETVDKMIERLDYDILYYENMSLMLDTKILLYTIQIVLTGKGI